VHGAGDRNSAGNTGSLLPPSALCRPEDQQRKSALPRGKTAVRKSVCMAFFLARQSVICTPGQRSQRRKSDFQRDTV